MSVFLKRGTTWYAKVKDGRGRWVGIPLQGVTTKTGAKALEGEIAAKFRRQRLGLDPLPSDCTETVGQICSAWLNGYLKGHPSYDTSERYVRNHILSASLGATPLAELTAPAVEQFLKTKDATHKPETINAIRGCISRAINFARRQERWSGPNVLENVPLRYVPPRAPAYLTAEEVPRVLAALGPEWRPLFATAVYTGLRKGELLALQKSDVDLAGRRLVVQRSWERETTKGKRKRVDSVPIAEELVPYLAAALAASRDSSELVFPDEGGRMFPRSVRLQAVLRRALKLAGVVKGFKHVCRKHGCGYEVRASDADPRFCETHKARKLCPKPEVRPLRFHDLRHTTASLLLMAGAPLQSVQQIMRHSDPKLTAVRYGHLSSDYLGAEINRLTFSPRPPAPEGQPARVAVGAEADRFGDTLGDSPSERVIEPGTTGGKVGVIPASYLVGASGVEPPTSTVSR